jgi:hypothetical protein
MKLSTKRKVEKALVGYLPDVLELGALKIYEGHDPAADMDFPALVIYAESAGGHPEMPVETGVKVVRVRMKFLVDEAAGGGRDTLDVWKEGLEEAMRCTPDLQAALNRPASGVDKRAVQEIHFHEVQAAEEPSDKSETDWDEEMNFDVICEPLSY